MTIPELWEEDFKRDFGTIKRGAESIVLRANHRLYGDVALKRYHEAFRDGDIKLLTENVRHPNIIKILGILTNSSTPPKRVGYMMPYMRMGSLDEIIHNEGKNYDDIYTHQQITSWIIKVCCGLSYLHEKKIVHRDIKSSNILLGESYDDVQLSDFGIVRSLCSIDHRMSTKYRAPLYMAPEMFQREDYDFSADIYSLSVTIWEILHRRIPYDHMKGYRVYDLGTKISSGERPQMSNELSKEVSGLLTSCWDKDASKRPTIHYIHEFSMKTQFLSVDLENSANECTTSFEHLNVPNDDDESLPQVSLKHPNENFLEEQTILLLGGDKEHSLLMLEDNGQSWKELNIKLPYEIWSHGAQSLNNDLYIFGGKNDKKALNFTYKLSKNLQWEKMANMNQKRFGISNSSVTLNNQIWVCGGYNRKSLKSVEIYDPETDKWKYMREMNECRSEAAAAVVNGKIFISGGWEWGDYLNSVEFYDPFSDVWTLISNMPQPIDGHGAVEINGSFIVMGGFNGNYLEHTWALNTTDEGAEWIEKPSMSIPHKAFSIGKIHDKVFVCGGQNTEGTTVEVFDGEVWTNGPEMPTRRYNSPAVVIPMQFARDLEQSISDSSSCSVQ